MCIHEWKTFGIFFPTQKCVKCLDTRQVPTKHEDQGSVGVASIATPGVSIALLHGEKFFRAHRGRRMKRKG
jgi:hypothetical protein